MIQPNIPVSLTVNISIVATITDTMQEVIGPQIKPPKVMTTSDETYFKNKITGILPITIKSRNHAVHNSVKHFYDPLHTLSKEIQLRFFTNSRRKPILS